MTSFATALLTISAGIWVGAIIFQTAVVAPTVFADLNESAARTFLRTLFPRFFRLGLVCGLVMLAGLIWLGVLAAWPPGVVALAVVTSVMVLFEAVSLRMVPQINAARDAGQAGEALFSRLHRISVLLTVVILLLGIAVLVAVSTLAAQGV
ncbi:MAG: DUF4149 domain-containing protein [Woeseiaceae bacterium]|nr:DUF4149 domain-containing protein [Woeseiaceae bacterium]